MSSWLASLEKGDSKLSKRSEVRFVYFGFVLSRNYGPQVFAHKGGLALLLFKIIGIAVILIAFLYGTHSFSMEEPKETQIDLDVAREIAQIGGKVGYIKETDEHIAGIYLSNCQVTGDLLSRISKLSNLQILSLRCIKGNSNTSLEHLKNLRKLVRLDLWGTNINDGSLKSIAKCDGIEELILDGTDITDRGISQLIALKKLRFLSCEITKLTNKSMDSIIQIKTLEELRLGGTRITNEGMRNLDSLAKLRTLSMMLTKLNDQSMQHLKKIHSLECLDLSGTDITDMSIPALLELEKLRLLNVRKTDITPAGLNRLRDRKGLRVIPEPEK